MRCPKCGKDWPSEYYFNSPEQCIECDRAEGKPVPPSTDRPSTVEARSKNFPDLIQLFFILVLVIDVLAVVGIGIHELRPLFSSEPELNVWIALPIAAVYDHGERAPVAGVDDPDLRIQISHHFATMTRFRTVPDFFRLAMLFAFIYASRLISIVIIILVWRFYRSVQRGRSFLRKNLNRVMIFGAFFTLIGPLEGLFGWWLAKLFIDDLSVPGATLHTYLNLNLGMFTWGLIILATVQIVKHGITLQQDHDLTI